jgi:hypothetical protein
MIMGARLRKVALTAHVACSVGSLGAIAGFLALAVAGLTSQDGPMVRSAYLAMELTAWFVVVPMVLAALLTGLVQALGTTWGLFRHYWVLVKLLVTVLVAVVVLLQVELIGYLANVAAKTTPLDADLRALRTSPVLHAASGLLVLLVALVLSLYKPRGMTRYGWRKRHEQPTVRVP